jgi:hypothetical protein
MRLQSSVLRSVLLLAVVVPCGAGTFAIVGTQAGSWPAVLSSVGHVPGPASVADIFVAPPGTLAAADWQAKVESGATLILEGASPLATSFGFRQHLETVPVLHLVDTHNPTLPVIWEKSVELHRTDAPYDALIFAKERWTGAPIVAGYRLGAGAVRRTAAPRAGGGRRCRTGVGRRRRAGRRGPDRPTRPCPFRPCLHRNQLGAADGTGSCCTWGAAPRRRATRTATRRSMTGHSSEWWAARDRRPWLLECVCACV